LNQSENKILPARWFQLPDNVLNHPEQTRFKNDFVTDKRNKTFVIAAGRRSFKTERAKRLLISECINNAEHIYYTGAPTRIQAKEIFWKDLKALTPKWLLNRQPSESELKIFFRNGTELRVVGLQEFRRVQGGRCNGFVFSEFQDCSPEAYTETVQPMLNDTAGWVLKEGRPFGKNHFYDDFLKGLLKEDNYYSYHWKSEDVLSAEQIILAKSQLAEQDYQREYEASFETASARAYYAYSELNNISYEYNPDIPVIVACDFNATEKPMSWIVGQRIKKNNNDITIWLKSLSFQYTNTSTMCEILEEYLKSINSNFSGIYFYGDYAGNHKTSNSSLSDWEIIEKYFTNKTKIEKYLKPCLSIRNSISSTNAQLCNSLGKRNQFVVASGCQELIKDWEYCSFKLNSRELDDKDNLLTHCCRAVDYYNYYEHPTQTKIETKISKVI